MKILLPHGITPTGVGVGQVTEGHLRPLSPCCGVPMNYTEDKDSVRCARCHENLKALFDSVRPKTLGNDVFVYEGAVQSLIEWLQTITGDPEATMTVEGDSA